MSSATPRWRPPRATAIWSVLAILGALLMGISLALPASAATSKALDTTTAYADDPGQWDFRLDWPEGQPNPPATVSITWQNGQTGSAALVRYQGGQQVYQTADNLTSPVISGSATVYDGYSGNFVIHSGPHPTAINLQVSLSNFQTDKPCVNIGETTSFTYVAHTNLKASAGVYYDNQLVDGLTLLAGDSPLSSVSEFAAGDHTLKLSFTSDDGQKADATLNVTVPACSTATPTPTPTQSTPPPGDNGDVKVHESGFPTDDQRNQPKVCGFYFDAFGFDGAQQVTWWVKAGPNFKGDSVLSGTIKLDENGHGYTPNYSLPNGQYKLFWTFDGENGKAKQKVFKVDCPAPTPSPTQTSTPIPTPTPTVTFKNPIVEVSSPQCADLGKVNGVADVSVTNPNSSSVDYTVKLGGQTQSLPLNGGETQTVKFTVTSGTYQVTVTGSDGTKAMTTVTVTQCAVSPSPSPTSSSTPTGSPSPSQTPTSAPTASPSNSPQPTMTGAVPGPVVTPTGQTPQPTRSRVGPAANTGVAMATQSGSSFNWMTWSGLIIMVGALLGLGVATRLQKRA